MLFKKRQVGSCQRQVAFFSSSMVFSGFLQMTFGLNRNDVHSSPKERKVAFLLGKSLVKWSEPKMSKWGMPQDFFFMKGAHRGYYCGVCDVIQE